MEDDETRPPTDRSGVATGRDVPEPEALASFFLDLPSAVVFTDDGGALRWVNPAAERILRRPGEALRAMRVWDLAAPDDRDDVRSRFDSYVDAEALETGVIELLRGDGIPRTYRYAAHPVPGGGHWSQLEDVTDHLADREADSAGRLEGIVHVAGGVAHVFNNLLTTILGCAELGLDELSPGNPLREELSEIREAALRGAEVSRQLLLVSGGIGAAQQRTDLPVLIAEEVEALGRHHPDVSCRAQLEPGLPSVWGEPGQLALALGHLLANAVEAMGAGAPGQIEVVARFRERLDPGPVDALEPTGAVLGPHVEIAVSDEGEGFAPDVLRRCFDPFFGTRRVGRGLGLAVVLGVVRLHGGVVWIARRTDGRPGSRVAMALPVFDDPHGELDSDPGGPLPLG